MLMKTRKMVVVAVSDPTTQLQGPAKRMQAFRCIFVDELKPSVWGKRQLLTSTFFKTVFVSEELLDAPKYQVEVLNKSIWMNHSDIQVLDEPVPATCFIVRRGLWNRLLWEWANWHSTNSGPPSTRGCEHCPYGEERGAQVHSIAFSGVFPPL